MVSLLCERPFPVCRGVGPRSAFGGLVLPLLASGGDCRVCRACVSAHCFPCDAFGCAVVLKALMTTTDHVRVPLLCLRFAVCTARLAIASRARRRLASCTWYSFECSLSSIVDVPVAFALSLPDLVRMHWRPHSVCLRADRSGRLGARWPLRYSPLLCKSCTALPPDASHAAIATILALGFTDSLFMTISCPGVQA